MSKVVYVLILKDEDDYEDYPSVWGVFTTKEKAIQHAKECIADKDNSELGYLYKEENFSIEERELDGGFIKGYKLFKKEGE